MHEVLPVRRRRGAAGGAADRIGGSELHHGLILHASCPNPTGWAALGLRQPPQCQYAAGSEAKRAITRRFAAGVIANRRSSGLSMQRSNRLHYVAVAERHIAVSRGSRGLSSSSTRPVRRQIMEKPPAPA